MCSQIENHLDGDSQHGVHKQNARQEEERDLQPTRPTSPHMSQVSCSKSLKIRADNITLLELLIMGLNMKVSKME